MEIRNKTVDYSVKASIGQNDKMEQMTDTASVQLPSFEYMTDTISGAGILGEIDWPTYANTGALSVTISMKADESKSVALAAPGLKKIEIRWAVDKFDSNKVQIGFESHKVVITGVCKKYDPGKVEKGATSDGSFDFEVLTYKKLVDGKTIIEIDKLAGKFVINGIDFGKKIRDAL